MFTLFFNDIYKNVFKKIEMKKKKLYEINNEIKNIEILDVGCVQVHGHRLWQKNMMILISQELINVKIFF